MCLEAFTGGAGAGNGLGVVQGVGGRPGHRERPEGAFPDAAHPCLGKTRSGSLPDANHLKLRKR